MTSIVIADDHDVVRSGVREILQLQSQWNVVGEARTGPEAVSILLALEPDVGIIDYSLPGLTGLDVTRRIRERGSRSEILLFTMHDNDVLREESAKVGVLGYVLKSDARTCLVAAVQSLARHKPYFSGCHDQAVSTAAMSASFAKVPLTKRERTIVQMVAEGLSNKSIAATLNLSLKTVESHRAAVMRKLNLSSAAALVRYAVRNGIVCA